MLRCPRELGRIPLSRDQWLSRAIDRSRLVGIDTVFVGPLMGAGHLFDLLLALALVARSADRWAGARWANRTARLPGRASQTCGCQASSLLGAVGYSSTSSLWKSFRISVQSRSQHGNRRGISSCVVSPIRMGELALGRPSRILTCLSGRALCHRCDRWMGDRRALRCRHRMGPTPLDSHARTDLRSKTSRRSVRLLKTQ